MDRKPEKSRLERKCRMSDELRTRRRLRQLSDLDAFLADRFDAIAAFTEKELSGSCDFTSSVRHVQLVAAKLCYDIRAEILNLESSRRRDR